MSYTIAGKKILNEHMALGVFAFYGVLGYSMSGGSKKTAAPASSGASASTSAPSPPLNASSSDEEAFIKQFLAEAEGGKSSDRMV